MGFYEDITNRYGMETAKNLKIWSSNNNKLASSRNRRIFLLECKRQELVPSHITSNMKNIMGLFEYENSKLNSKIRDFNEKTIRKILNLEISQVNYKITKIENDNKKIKNAVQHLPRQILTEYSHRMHKAYNKRFHEVKKVNMKKIEDLNRKKRNHIEIQEKWLKNLSKKTIPDTVKNLLSLGSKFSLPITNKDIKIENIIADVEYALLAVPENRRDIIRAQATNTITNLTHKNNMESSLVNKWYNETKRFLRENDDLLILDSDKGAVTVIMEKTEYENKIQSILDSKDFKKIHRDPTSTIQNTCNKLVSRLCDKGYITQQHAKEMKTYNSVCPRIYGNPKVHKTNNPLRPIISSTNSPMSKLSKLIADILKSAYDTNNEYYIKDTFDFAHQINNFQLPNNHKLASFDVVNLFGNLEKNKIMEVLEKKWDKIRTHTKIEKKVFMEITMFLLENNYCTFRGKFYQQVFGCAMGSKLSPILSLYVMDDLLENCIQKLKFRIPLLKKFVDDIIIALPEDEIENTLKCFNSYCEDLQFTIEMEDQDQGVPFLDTKVHRQNQSIKLNWYRKNTSSNKFINYHSNHNINIKINFIRGMKDRIERICHESFRQDGLRELFEILRQNSYPKTLLNKLLYASNGTHVSMETNQENEVTGEKLYVSFPNINKLTSKLKTIFRDENVLITTFNQKTVKSLYSRLKDPIPKTLKSNVVYQLNCQDCDNVYIGQTSQWMKSRISLHKSDINRYKDRCALATHSHDLDHRIDFQNVEILKTENNYHKRLIHEMIQINKHDNTINKKSDTHKLSNIYSYLLEKTKGNEYYEGPLDE